LQDFQSNLDDFQIARIQSSFDRDDELRDHGQDLGAALLEHIKGSLDREEAVGFVLFADSFEENWEVVMVV